MKLIGATFAIATCCALAVTAQEIKTTTKEKSKIEIKGGKTVEVSGCVDRSVEGHYVLTNESGGLKYLLVTDDNLSKYVGRLVEVKGTATDRGDAKVKIEKTVGSSGEIAGKKLDDQKLVPAASAIEQLREQRFAGGIGQFVERERGKHRAG